VMVAELLADTRESRRRSAAAMGAATTAAAAVTAAGAPRLSAASRHARLAGHHAETLRSLSRPAQGPALWARDPLSGHQEAGQEAPQEAAHDGEGRLTSPAHPPWPPTSVDGQPGIPGLNHKLLRGRPRGVSSQAPDLHKRKIGITPFDCPCDKRVVGRRWG
jgi:hypothetical protein